MRTNIVGALGLLLAASACGGSSSVGPGGASTSACPGAPPADGSECLSPGSAGSGSGFNVADCSWGDDVRPRCRTTGVCQQGKWTITEAGDGCVDPPLPAACAAEQPTVGSACAAVGLECWYQDGSVCSCSPCKNGAEYPICQTIDPPEWACAKPTEGCPNPPPQAGTACDDAGLQCGTSCELPIRCEGGVWQWGQEMCPICAAPDTPIATPLGERAIAALRVGDLVYSVDEGAIVAVPIVRAGSTPVHDHRALRLVLQGGASLEISPGHPMADGRPLSSLQAGGRLDEQHAVVSVELVPYRYARTYDILPASSTGTYFAAGAMLGSTLAVGRRPTSPNSP
jgi:hypothetical protein